MTIGDYDVTVEKCGRRELGVFVRRRGKTMYAALCDSVAEGVQDAEAWIDAQRRPQRQTAAVPQMRSYPDVPVKPDRHLEKLSRR